MNLPVGKFGSRARRRAAQPRLAMIGCGAVAELYYLPALRGMGWTPTVLADRDVERVSGLAAEWGSRFVSDHAEAVDDFDAAVVAIPNALHSAVVCDLLTRGKHVLVEKPMATTLSDCELMIALAEKNDLVLAVGLWRRYLQGTRDLKSLLESGRLGPIESFEFRDGFAYNWPLASDAQWRKDLAGGGVLFDMGPHTLDLLIWWLGQAGVVAYLDDSHGGVEADCLIQLELETGARGVVELSRTRNIGSSALLRGAGGAVEISLWDGRMRTSPPDLASATRDRGHESPREQILRTFRAQLSDWRDAIETDASPLVSGAEGARSVGLIEACYAKRQVWDLPWISPLAGVAGLSPDRSP